MVSGTDLDRILSEAGEVRGPAIPENGKRPVVLFGAGLLGRTMLAGLRKVGVEPAAFADDTPGKGGTLVDGVPVLPPAEAARRFGTDGAWVVTILNPAHRFLDSRRRLRQMGCAHVSSFLHLARQYPDVFLPYYQFDLPAKILSSAARIRQAFALLADDASRRQFLAHLAFRLRLDHAVLPPASADPYFPPGLVRPLPEDVVFVDGGAYTGDTLRRFLEVQGGAFREVIAVEPDRENFRGLSEYVASLDGRPAGRIQLHQAALGRLPGTTRFNGLGNMSAAIDAGGAYEVEVLPLDQLLNREPHTYIKLDIEGGEADALRGCRTVLRESAPLLAVCVYHRPEDLWEIPLFVHSVNPGYRFYLSTEGTDGMDVVCYAVPRTGGSR